MTTYANIRMQEIFIMFGNPFSRYKKFSHEIIIKINSFIGNLVRKIVIKFFITNTITKRISKVSFQLMMIQIDPRIKKQTQAKIF
jgi:hypothetical protein